MAENSGSDDGRLVYEKTAEGHHKWFPSRRSRLSEPSVQRNDFDLNYEIEKNINVQVGSCRS